MSNRILAIRTLTKVLATGAILLAATGDIRAAEGHGGGAGHAAVGGFAGRGGYGGYGGYGRGYGYGRYGYGYGGYGFGYGLGLGLGLGYYAGYPYYGGYPYYTYPDYGVPYPYGYPGYAAPPSAVPVGPVAPSLAASPGIAIPVIPASGHSPDSDVALIVRIPADATVWINGSKTTQTGPRREFVSTGLAPGRSYTFDIRAQWTGPDGQTFDVHRRVPAQAGERRSVDFLQRVPPESDLANGRSVGGPQ